MEPIHPYRRASDFEGQKLARAEMWFRPRGCTCPPDCVKCPPLRCLCSSGTRALNHRKDPPCTCPPRCTCPPDTSYPGPSSYRSSHPTSRDPSPDYDLPLSRNLPFRPGGFGGLPPPPLRDQPLRPGRLAILPPPPSRDQPRKPKKNSSSNPRSFNSRSSNPGPSSSRPSNSRSTNLPQSDHRSGPPRSRRGPPAIEERFSTMSIRPPDESGRQPVRRNNGPMDSLPPPHAPPAGRRNRQLSTIWASED